MYVPTIEERQILRIFEKASSGVPVVAGSAT